MRSSPRCAALLALLALSGPAHAGSVRVVGELTHRVEGLPGEVHRGEIALENGGDEPVTVRLSQRDYRFFADGRSEWAEPGAVARSNAAWIRLVPEQLTLPAGGRATATWSMQIPAEVPADGTWWSVVMVEPVPDPFGTVDGLAVRSVFRYAIQLVAEIGDPQPPTVAFAAATLAAGPSGPQLAVDVENTGQTWVTPAAWVQLHAEDGREIGRFEGDRARLYPGCSHRFRVDLPGVGPGRYSALLVADGGSDALFGTRLDLDLTGLAAGAVDASP